MVGWPGRVDTHHGVLGSMMTTSARAAALEYRSGMSAVQKGPAGLSAHAGAIRTSVLCTAMATTSPCWLRAV